MTTILGLDISSSSTGFAILDIETNKIIHIGMVKLKHKTHAERLLVFEKTLENLITTYKPTFIAVEDIFAGRFITALRVLAYYHGIVYKTVYKYYKCEPIIHTATNIRKIIGKKFQVNLLPGRKEKLITGKDSKSLTFDFITDYFKFKNMVFKKHNDQVDAAAVVLAISILKENNDLIFGTYGYNND